MKIYFFCGPVGNRKYGGVSIVAERLLFLLKKNNFDTNIISSSPLFPPKYGSFERHYIKSVNTIDKLNLKFFLKSIYVFLINLFRKKELSIDCDGDDVIFIVNSFIDDDLNKINFTNTRSLKKMCIVHGDVSSFTFQKSSKMTYTEAINDAKIFLNYFNSIIYISDTTKENWEKLIKKPSHMLYNSIDEQQAKKEKNLVDNLVLKKNKDIIDVVLVGSVQDRKGQDILKKIAPRFINKCNFHVVGAVSNRWGGSEIYQSLKDIKNIIFHGYQANPLRFVDACEIALCVSRSEAFPLTIAEYLFFGKPIISTNVSGADQMIIDNYNGFLVDIDDYVSIVNKLDYIISNPACIRKFGTNSYHHYYENYSEDIQEKNFINILNE